MPNIYLNIKYNNKHERGSDLPGQPAHVSLGGWGVDTGDDTRTAETARGHEGCEGFLCES
jgi:hypothetical protein